MTYEFVEGSSSEATFLLALRNSPGFGHTLIDM